MSKAVLISIRPKWCELIASGEKTIEVRKTRPKLETPFKCYIYETRGFERVGNDNLNCVIGGNGRGMVIGEFICDEVARYAKYGYCREPARYMKSSPGGYPATEIHFQSLQLSPDDLEQYGEGSPLYGWHVSNLVIYDKPRAISEFTGLKKTRFGYAPYVITRPQQSYCYVEELP